jgi:hypothetical protein
MRCASQRPTTIASSASISRATMGFGTTRAQAVAVCSCRLRDRDRADTDVVGAMRPLLNRADPRWRLDLTLRQTVCIARPLKFPPEAPLGTPSRLPWRHHGSVTNVTRFPTRDCDDMGFVAVEALQRFINRADPSLETGQLRFPPEAPLEHLRDRNDVSMGSLMSTVMVMCGETSEDTHSALTSGVETRSEAEGKIKGRPLS